MTTYPNMFTKIFSQIDDGSTALTVFASVDEAKSYFFTADALSCVDSHTTQVAYQLVADGNGDNTKLKKTEGFDGLSGTTYNTVKTALIDAGNWSANDFNFEESEDHLF